MLNPQGGGTPPGRFLFLLTGLSNRISYYGSCIGRCAPQLKLMRKPPKVYFLLLFRALATLETKRYDEDPDDRDKHVAKNAFLALFLVFPRVWS